MPQRKARQVHCWHSPCAPTSDFCVLCVLCGSVLHFFDPQSMQGGWLCRRKGQVGQVVM
jgi:hypothetical protein